MAKKKRDYTDYKSSVCKTAWVNIFKPSKPRNEKEAEAAAEGTWKRKCTFKIPKNIDVIDAKISDEGKKKLVKAGVEFRKLLRTKALAAALMEFEDCDTKEELDDMGIRWDPILDGDSKKLVKADSSNCGFWIIRSSTNKHYHGATQELTVKDREGNTLEDLPSGSWAKTHFVLAPYNVDGGLGITTYMGNILKCYSGTSSFSAAAFMDEDMDDLEDEEVSEASDTEDQEEDDDIGF